MHSIWGFSISTKANTLLIHYAAPRAAAYAAAWRHLVFTGAATARR
jgi:hypothetical protein